MIHDLEVDQLRAFVAVAETGGFTKAARRLHRTQSAVSMRIRRLEESLGSRVFERSRRMVRLTGDGEFLLRHARRMLSLNDEVVAELAQPDITGLVRLGIPDGYGTYFLPRVLTSFAHARPHVRLEITCGLTRILLESLASDRLDLAIAARDTNEPLGKLLWTEATDWVCSKDYVAPDGQPTPLALFEEGCIFRLRAMNAMDTAGKKWRIAYSTGSLAAVQAAVMAGLAVSLLPRNSVLPGMRVLGPGDGFPAMPASEIELRHGSADPSAAVDSLAEHIINNLDESVAHAS